jgi:hypothetical protein
MRISLLTYHEDTITKCSVYSALSPNRGIMRIVNSRTLNRPIRTVFGDRVDRLKEAAGLGWTLMALADKKS